MKTKSLLSEIWGSDTGDTEGCCLLACDPVCSHRIIPTFRRTPLPQLLCRSNLMKGAHFTETSVNFYQTTRSRTRETAGVETIVVPILYLLTYLLTPWSIVLLEKLTGTAASQEIPRIFGTRRFLTVPTSARHLSLSWANSIQSPQLPLTSWRSM